MLDIDFYMKFDSVLKKIKCNKINRDQVFEELEAIRSKRPIIYNIETTNRCNMRCAMCPRTTMMTRSIEDIQMHTFKKVVEQIEPHSYELLKKWNDFCEKKYGIKENDVPSENHFFLYIISKVIQLHGYGDPLLDSNMDKYISILTNAGFLTYFSCNPTNINLERTYKMLDAGLSYIKYSIESVSDDENLKIRGKMRSFSQYYDDIIKVLNYVESHGLSTTIVITMLDLNRENQQEEYDKLKAAFAGKNVYLYLKSEDCQWYRKEYHGTSSIHWAEPCKHPWMTMTIKSNGEATSCMEDYNNDIILGNVNEQTLYEIWNGESYRNFRKEHLNPNMTLRCNAKCDMKLLGNYI